VINIIDYLCNKKEDLIKIIYFLENNEKCDIVNILDCQLNSSQQLPDFFMKTNDKLSVYHVNWPLIDFKKEKYDNIVFPIY
jgi:hypothetical protein